MANVSTTNFAFVDEVDSKKEANKRIAEGWKVIQVKGKDKPVYVMGYGETNAGSEEKKEKPNFMIPLIKIVIGLAIVIVVFPQGRQDLFGFNYTPIQTAALIIAIFIFLSGISAFLEFFGSKK